MDSARGKRAATPLVGNILLVAVALVIAVVLVTLSFSFLDATGTPTAEAEFEYEQTAAGLEMRPVALGTDVHVELNGQRVATFESDSAGQRKLIPTAPGDRLVVVSADGERTVLVEEEIDDRSEIGDFISYYTFDSGSGDVVDDRSGNGNDGDIEEVGGNDGPVRAGCGLSFDGDDDYVDVDDITVEDVDSVDEFTIAVAYEQTGSQGRVNQLIEHQFSGGEEWFLETSSAGNSESYNPGEYSVDYAVEYPDEVTASGEVSLTTRHVAVGTYDGSNYELYVDGESVGSGTHSETVGMGALRIGKDFESDSQYFDGQMCEIRLYYTAFDGDEVERITEVMD